MHRSTSLPLLFVTLAACGRSEPQRSPPARPASTPAQARDVAPTPPLAPTAPPIAPPTPTAGPTAPPTAPAPIAQARDAETPMYLAGGQWVSVPDARRFVPPGATPRIYEVTRWETDGAGGCGMGGCGFYFTARDVPGDVEYVDGNPQLARTGCLQRARPEGDFHRWNAIEVYPIGHGGHFPACYVETYPGDGGFERWAVTRVRISDAAR